jgi:hypothetical protein
MHWTYRRAPSRSNLEQGDILLPTRRLGRLFRRVHPHFDDPKYLGYVVTTQTCDLVRRGKSRTCDAQYISVAVIKPLDQVLFDLLDEVCKPIVRGAYRAADREKAKDLLRRIFNQNEWKLGLFYLHADADLVTKARRSEPSGFGDNGVCLLRVSVALMRKHYDVLKAARCGRLRAEFADKLGWMVGNLYSRVATPDWEGAKGGGGVEQLAQLVSDYIGASASPTRPIWVAEDVLVALESAQAQLRGMTREALVEKLETLPVETSLDRAVGQVAKDIGSILKGVSPQDVEKICNRLRNNGKFLKALRN